jgi:hypothetical protein
VRKPCQALAEPGQEPLVRYSSVITGVCETDRSHDETPLPLNDSAFMHIPSCKINLLYPPLRFR